MSTGKIKAAPEWDRGAAVVFVRWFWGVDDPGCDVWGHTLDFLDGCRK